MVPAEKTARNEELYKRRLAGLPYKAIAAEYGISAPRARQIVCKQERKRARLDDSQSDWRTV